MCELFIDNAEITDTVVCNNGLIIVRINSEPIGEVNLLLTDYSVISGDRRPAIRTGDYVNVRALELEDERTDNNRTATPLSIELINLM